jgi:hypothetical protein
MTTTTGADLAIAEARYEDACVELEMRAAQERDLAERHKRAVKARERALLLQVEAFEDLKHAEESTS